MRKLCANCCTVKALILLTAALLVLLTGVLVLSFVGIPRIINHELALSMRLDKHTDQWERFVNLPIPIVTKVYLFTVANPAAILEGAKPIVVEKGPYVYKQKLTKKILRTDESDDSVTYEKYSSVNFDQELSGQNRVNDTVTVLNPALLVLTQITSPLEQLAATGCLDKLFLPEYNKLFIETTVETLMFKGFPFANSTEEMGYACNIIRNQVIEKTKIMKNVQFIMNKDFDMVQLLRFSYLGFKINQPDGVYTVNRGIKDISQLGTIMKWNHSSEVPFWGRLQSTNNETCKRVGGTDSTIYAPFVKKTDVLEIFSTDICRTVNIYYTGEGSYKGLKGYVFEPKNTTFYSSIIPKEEDCFCTQKTLYYNGQKSCYLDGILDVYDCFGAPLILSFPHFLYAEKYLDAVENLTKPDKDKHGIYLLIEPNTGVPLQGKKRVQLNQILRPIKHMAFAANLPQTIIPLLWIDEGAELNDDLIDMLNSKFFNVVKLTSGVKYGLIAVSAAGVLVAGGFLYRKKVLKW
ncbi:unnamed protein product [Phyllotreta striolata]|uniref:Sensory neuron membrane protein 2 n=1 Tax=Phyllotreta striolata TaxID=444603 RepID=A0A9N9TUG4_PHYSR|nr:unnamed protein product [Phyllotreta striolata]